tara:strand:- start:263 stop:499 length:237 start_codon:yes stop_codon:yes gene_type:complete
MPSTCRPGEDLAYFVIDVAPDQRQYWTYAEIRDRIVSEVPETRGEHISVQLEALGLYAPLQSHGHTPYMLPYTFVEAD